MNFGGHTKLTATAEVIGTTPLIEQALVSLYQCKGLMMSENRRQWVNVALAALCFAVDEKPMLDSFKGAAQASAEAVAHADKETA